MGIVEKQKLRKYSRVYLGVISIVGMSENMVGSTCFCLVPCI